MIAFLKGRPMIAGQDLLVIDVHGVGYLVHATQKLIQLAASVQEMSVHVELQLRQDSLMLFGFETVKEREMFCLLTQVSGVGGKLAMAVLNSLSLEAIASASIAQDANIMRKVPGVGPKLAQKMLLDLKGKAERIAQPLASGAMQDAVEALVCLGISRQEAQIRVDKVAKAADGTLALEELIRRALS